MKLFKVPREIEPPVLRRCETLVMDGPGDNLVLRSMDGKETIVNPITGNGWTLGKDKDEYRVNPTGKLSNRR